MRRSRHILGCTKIELQLLHIMSIVLLLGFVTCAPKRYRKYVDDDIVRKTEPELQEIDLYFSTLDSLKPYVHRFPTGGVAVEAPRIDPREFVSPDSLVKKFMELGQTDLMVHELLGLPMRDYEVIGEVETGIQASKSVKPEDIRPYERIAGGVVTEKRLTGTPVGPHKKHWIDLLGAQWDVSFKTLRKTARDMGADAVIEVFCGTGVYYFAREAGSSRALAIHSNLVSVWETEEKLPFEEGPLRCVLRGLAVRWRD